MGEGDVFIDEEAFDLRESSVMGSIDSFVAESASGYNDAERSAVFFHRANLDGGSMSAKNESFVVRVGFFVYEEGVLHVAGGMVGWNI